MKYIIHFSTIIGLILLASCGPSSISSGDGFQQVDLPDGSVVNLNKNSTISFDSDFSDRTVHLQGEALFEVVEGNGEFTVKTESGEVVVMGTIFNVKDRDDEMEVEVEEGEVELKAGGKKNRLKKGNRASFKKGNGLKLGQANFKHKEWVKLMKADFKAVGKEFKNAGKDIGRESKEVGKDIGKEGKKLGKGLKEAAKDAKKKLKN